MLSSEHYLHDASSHDVLVFLSLSTALNTLQVFNTKFDAPDLFYIILYGFTNRWFLLRLLILLSLLRLLLLEHLLVHLSCHCARQIFV
ncbi:hypothetical protein L596_006057 [Steinernema carpocapsae]|uniref:Uncharacterized protein n=1 Tax=Steinernema carpocapsae TaxID=34508 RepID=A0A4U8V122_STECR|nr:hypothetical protein L596_006057 [Steinernema carpocapsae]